MKKGFSIVMVLLVQFLIFSSIEIRTLTVYGILEDGNVTFTAIPVGTERINLTSNIVRSIGPGAKIGDISVSRNNGSKSKFILSYTYGPLVDQNPEFSPPTEINFVLLIDDTDDEIDNPTEHVTGSNSLAFDGSGGFSVMKSVFFRLTALGETTTESAPPGDYISDVIITLSIN